MLLELIGIEGLIKSNGKLAIKKKKLSIAFFFKYTSIIQTRFARIWFVFGVLNTFFHILF